MILSHTSRPGLTHCCEVRLTRSCCMTLAAIFWAWSESENAVFEPIIGTHIGTYIYVHVCTYIFSTFHILYSNLMSKYFFFACVFVNILFGNFWSKVSLLAVCFLIAWPVVANSWTTMLTWTVEPYPPPPDHIDSGLAHSKYWHVGLRFGLLLGRSCSCCSSETRWWWRGGVCDTWCNEPVCVWDPGGRHSAEGPTGRGDECATPESVDDHQRNL